MRRGLRLFLSGDLMTGRGVDQILPHPVAPQIFEAYVRSASDYVMFAEEAHGPIARPVPFEYIWGDALAELQRMQPHARIVNLETAVTTREVPWRDKGIHYRMHPENLPCLEALSVDCCVLANNHVLDWGREGLRETLDSLHAAGIQTAGAGANLAEALQPAVIDIPNAGARVLVYALAMEDSGVPISWRATTERSGVNVLDDLSDASLQRLRSAIQAHKREFDIVVVSLHWGPNWGFEVSADQRAFAHQLLDTAGVDVVHGHSSHHVKGIEVYHDKLVLYGCGDILNDYEGIGGHEGYRGQLSLMYFPELDVETGRLRELIMTPTCTRHLRINRADRVQTDWLYAILNREGSKLGTSVTRLPNGTLGLRWE